jgi:choline dehydrogenase-like flavoprotein
MSRQILPDNFKNELPYDVCIIGSGPAGLTLASELARSGKRLCILESGRDQRISYAEKLKAVVSTGEIKIRPYSRERRLGGTSTTWAGLSSPLDPIDFELWPFSKKELDPYYERAHAYGFPQLKDFQSEKMDDMRGSDDFTRLFSGFQEKVFIAGDPAWDFGKKLERLFEQQNVDLFLDATVTDFKTEKDAVSEVMIQSSSGSSGRVRAKYFVIAAGGIESTRLLLTSGLGNEHGQVGKYLTNHPKGFFGVIKLKRKIKKLPHLFGFLHNNRSEYIGLSFDETTLRNKKLLNSYIRFEPVFPWTDNRGVEALVLFMKKTKFFLLLWKKRQKERVDLKDWSETGDNAEQASSFGLGKTFLLIPTIMRHFPGVCAYSLHRLFPKKELHVQKIRIRNFMDMEAREENRMTLGTTKDQYGKPIPEISINTSEQDHLSLVALHKHLQEELVKNNIGTLEGDFSKAPAWPIKADASHHLGGTIMGTDPRRSVVDPNLKVHSVDNLYVASGSVFPTAGCANPTYTICALSIRLADHLMSKV